MKNILHINSSGRYEGSVTRQVSDLVVTHLREENSALEIVSRDLAVGIPFVDELWIDANFTAAEERTNSQIEALKFSDELVAEIQNAEYIVIAAPIYNFSIPAVLKAWVDLIVRVNFTFQFTENGQPEGLLENKKTFVVMASGGTAVGSDIDLASAYLKFVLGILGLSDVIIIDSSKIDHTGDENLQIAMNQIEGLVGEKQ